MWSSVQTVGRWVSQINQVFSRLLDRIEKMPQSRRLFVLFLVTYLCATPLMLGYAIADDPERLEKTDIPIFRDRVETILDGEWLYEDTEKITVTPPLINYLLVPAVLLGDTLVIWELWFTFFIFLSSVLLFYIIEPNFGTRSAISASMLFASSPFAFFTSVAMVQDDAIIVVFLLLAFLFLARLMWLSAAVVFGLGTMTKLFPALCAPLAFFGPKEIQTKLKVVCFGLGSALLISLPFILFAQEGFFQFIEFYLLGRQPTSSTQAFEEVSLITQRGMSFWKFLAVMGLVIPTGLLHGMLLISVVGIWAAVMKEKLDIQTGFLLCILSIFVFYSKIHFGYHLMILGLLIPHSYQNLSRLWSLFFVSLMAMIVHVAWRGYIPSIPNWLIFFLSLCIWVYWISWSVLLVKESNQSSENRPIQVNEDRHQSTFWMMGLSLCISVLLGLNKLV